MQDKKRILVFIPEFPALTETFIEREVSALSGRPSLAVTVYALKKGKGHISSSLAGRVSYLRLNLQLIISAIPFLFLRITKVISSLGLLDNKSSIYFRMYLWLKSLVYAYSFSKYHPELILSHFLSTPSTMALIASHILGIPFGISAHAKDIFVTADHVQKKIEKASFILVCNKNAHMFLQKSYPNFKQKFILQYHGMVINPTLNEVPPVSSELPLILNIGRLTEKKGHKYLIEASKILMEKGVKHRINIVGPGPLYEDLKSYVKELDLVNTVLFPGDGNGLPYEEVEKLYKASSVFAFPSIQTESGDVDGVANVLLEAAYYRVPIVATRSGSTEDLIEDQVSGLLISQRSSRELASALEKLLSDKALAARLCSSAYLKVTSYFDVSKNVENIEKFIGEVFV